MTSTPENMPNSAGENTNNPPPADPPASQATIEDTRRWYKKLRFILPLSFIIAFFIIFGIWFSYTKILISMDSDIQHNKNSTSLDTLPYSYINDLYPSSFLNSDSELIETQEMTKLEQIGNRYGTYGDTYGSLNTLFTGWAFAGLIISIILQMLELKATRKEFAKQSEEFAKQSQALVDQKKQFKKQTKILKKQAQIAEDQKTINENQQKFINDQYKESQKIDFQNHFFKLIDQKNLMLNSLTMPSDEGLIHGHAVFYEYNLEFRKFRSKFDPSEHNYKFMEEHWNNFTKEKYGSYNYQLRSYFKIYYIIFHTIGNSKSISDTEKKYYANVVRMLLTVEEQLILMWISTFDKYLRNYCNKYGLLNGIYNPNLEKIGTYFFKVEAFGKTSEWAKIFEAYEKEKTAKDSDQSTTTAQPQSNEP